MNWTTHRNSQPQPLQNLTLAGHTLLQATPSAVRVDTNGPRARVRRRNQWTVGLTEAPLLGRKSATAQTGHGVRSGRFGFQRPQMAEDQREVEVRGERQLVIWPRGVAQPEVEPTGVAQPELAVGLMTGRLSSQPVRALWAAASTPADRSQPPHHASPLSTCAADS